MTPEKEFLIPELELAVSEIRSESVDSSVVEAAAGRVWARLSQASAEIGPGDHIRSCADFQALIPAYRAGSLIPARALLLKDHIHACVACRRVFEGRVVAMPAARPAAPRRVHTVRWAAAAAAVAAAGIYIWVGLEGSTANGRAIVQSVNGSLYEITAAGIRPLTAGQPLPDGVEVRTARDSDAMLQLRDGSVVELRERSGFQTSQDSRDLTIRLDHGSIIVQAAKRKAGHLYVDTADCRVAVTGTVFGVSAGIKGSRVSVVQGEVHVTRENEEKVLHPGDQTVTSAGMEPESVREDIGWSRNRDRYYALLASIRAGIDQLHLPELRYSSALLNRLPVSTVFYAAIPNLAQYLTDAEGIFRQKAAANPELGGLWNGKAGSVLPLLDKLRDASSYLGEEVAVVMFTAPDGQKMAPVLFAETKRPGFSEFLSGLKLPLAVEARNGMVAFGPDRNAVEQFAPAMDAPAGGFPGTPFYARISEVYRQGAGLLLCADLSRLAPANGGSPFNGVHYVIAEQKEVNHQMEARASMGFDGARSGFAGWLAAPAPMGSLDYVSPDATFVASFITRDAGATVDAVAGLLRKSVADLGPEGVELRADLAASLSGEVALALDGPLFPVPSWKLVAEVYDSSRLQTALQKASQVYHLRTAQETVDGRTIYMIAGADPNPLTEVHYVIAGGYLVAAPTKALITRSLQAKAGGVSILHSSKFLAMVPRDRFVNFSAVVYENLGTTLAPLAGLAGSFMPNMNRSQQQGLQRLGNLKPMLYAAYGEPDRMTIASSDNVLGTGLSNLMTGNISGIVGSAIPLQQFTGARR